MQLSQRPAFTEVRLPLSQVRGQTPEVAVNARCAKGASARDSMSAIDSRGAPMDPRLHAIYIDAVFKDWGRRSTGLAGLADHEHAHDERPLRRAIRTARRAGGGVARRRRGPSVPRASWR